MRDILLTLVVFGFIPFILVRPYVGVLVWSWLGFMSPHGLTYGFAYEFPFSKIVGVVTILAFLFYKDKHLPRSSWVLWLFLMYVTWSSVTTMFALNPEEAMMTWGGFMKVVLMMVITMMMTNNKERLHALLAVVVFSVGYYGVKGGIFTLMTAGNYRVWGPAQSMIEDNNALGLALVMLLPLMRYMQNSFDAKWLKRLMIVVMILTAFAVLGTQSRGAFVALIAMVGFLVLKSRSKFKALFAIVLLAPLLFAFMPQSWHERMDSIKNYQQDDSAMMRIKAWDYTLNLVADYPATGGGYDTYTEELYTVYSKKYDEYEWTGPHSIYFETLGEHGWIGLIIYVLMGIALYMSLGYIVKRAKQFEDLRWMSDFAAMSQVSMIGFAVAGAFLELAKLDLYMMLIVFTVIMLTMLKKRIDEEESTELVQEKQKSPGVYHESTPGLTTSNAM